ncbi:hypothetical protein EV122DRAFT_256817 [Schizophyllum commune]
MSGDGNAPGVQDLQRRLQENQEGQEEGEIREEAPTQEPPPAGQTPHPNTQGGTPSELGSPQSMAVDPVSVVDPSRLCLHSRDGRRLRNHTPRQVGCPNNREPGGVDEYDVPMDYANSSAAFPDNGKWSARGYEASIHEMTLGWNATTAQRLKQNPAGFIVIRPFFSTGLRLRDADDAIPAAVREHLAVMYPPLAEANVMWAGSLADAKNCEGRLAHGHRQGPNFIIIPERENLPQNFVNLLFEHRIWAFTENLAFIAIKPEQADASWYIASFACNVPSDSIITRSKVLSLVRCAVEGHRTLANFAREFTAALPQRPEKERVREVLDTWDIRHIMVGTQHVWQLTGMPPRKEGQPDPHLRAKKEIQDMLSKSVTPAATSTTPPNTARSSRPPIGVAPAQSAQLAPSPEMRTALWRTLTTPASGEVEEVAVDMAAEVVEEAIAVEEAEAVAAAGASRVGRETHRNSTTATGPLAGRPPGEGMGVGASHHSWPRHDGYNASGSQSTRGPISGPQPRGPYPRGGSSPPATPWDQSEERIWTSAARGPSPVGDEGGEAANANFPGSELNSNIPDASSRSGRRRQVGPRPTSAPAVNAVSVREPNQGPGRRNPNDKDTDQSETSASWTLSQPAPKRQIEHRGESVSAVQ